MIHPELLPPPPPFTAARVVCERHAVFATTGGSVATDAISRYLDLPVSRTSFAHAATLDSTVLLQRLVYHAQTQRIDAFLLELWLTRAARTAGEHGHLATVRLLLRYSSECAPSYWTSCAEAVAEGAMAGAHLALLQETTEALGLRYGSSFCGSLKVPVVSVDLLRWLHSIGVRLENSELFVPSNRREEDILAALQWTQQSIHAAGGLDLSGLLTSAASGGYERVVRYLVETCGVTASWTTTALSGAFDHTPSSRLTYLLGRGVSERDLNKLMALMRFIRAGALANAELVLARYPQLWSEMCERRVPGQLQCAVESGRRDVIDWVLRYHREHHGTMASLETSKRLIQAAAGGGHLEMVQWLHNHSNPDWDGSWPIGEGDGREVMQKLVGYHAEPYEYEAETAVCNGHLDVVRWLVANRPEGFAEVNLYLAIGKGHLSVLQFLHEHGLWQAYDAPDDEEDEEVEEKEEERVEAFSEAVALGHLEVVMWLQAHWGTVCSQKVMYCADPVDFATVKWVHAHAVATPGDEDAPSQIAERVKELVLLRRRGVHEWLFANGLFVTGLTSSVVNFVTMGDLLTVQWFAARVPQLVNWNALRQVAFESEQHHIVTWLTAQPTPATMIAADQ